MKSDDTLIRIIASVADHLSDGRAIAITISAMAAGILLNLYLG